MEAEELQKIMLKIMQYNSKTPGKNLNSKPATQTKITQEYNFAFTYLVKNIEGLGSSRI